MTGHLPLRENTTVKSMSVKLEFSALPLSFSLQHGWRVREIPSEGNKPIMPLFLTVTFLPEGAWPGQL